MTTKEAATVPIGVAGVAIADVVLVNAVRAEADVVVREGAVVDCSLKSIGYHPRQVSQYGTPPEYVLLALGQFVQYVVEYM